MSNPTTSATKPNREQKKKVQLTVETSVFSVRPFPFSSASITLSVNVMSSTSTKVHIRQ